MNCIVALHIATISRAATARDWREFRHKTETARSFVKNLSPVNGSLLLGSAFKEQFPLRFQIAHVKGNLSGFLNGALEEQLLAQRSS